MKSNYQALENETENKDNIISFSSRTAIFRVDEIILAIQDAFNSYALGAFQNKLSSRGRIPGNSHSWSTQGVDCEILKPGKNWQKGKVKLKLILEFCPELPEIEDAGSEDILATLKSETSLDEIRQMLNKDN
ncbi:KGK domain-containing protein [Gloeocapsa sp. BRSZ]